MQLAAPAPTTASTAAHAVATAGVASSVWQYNASWKPTLSKVQLLQHRVGAAFQTALLQVLQWHYVLTTTQCFVFAAAL
jgi:hypothetical protein